MWVLAGDVRPEAQDETPLDVRTRVYWSKIDRERTHCVAFVPHNIYLALLLEKKKKKKHKTGVFSALL